MSTVSDQVKLIEQCRISPPPTSVPTTSIPLTFFDASWIAFRPIQRVFLYQVSFSAAQFTEEVLPLLKNSLSLALQRFFPLCGNLVLAPQPLEPYILYKDGDSVSLLIAQSTGTFKDFLSDGPKDAKMAHLLVPPTPAAYVTDDTLMEHTPLFSIQVTLFPSSGICIGFDFRHVVADGMSFNHFVKTWASIFKANCDMSIVSISLPVHDRGVIKDPNGIKDIVLDQWRVRGSLTWNETVAHREDNVRATFTVSRIDIDRLKKWVTAKCDNGTKTEPNFHFSSFVVTTAFIWACLIKSLDAVAANGPSKDDELCHFLVATDCRNRYDLGIPVTYFGNCLTAKFVSMARNKFRQEDCVALAAKAISHTVQSFNDGVQDVLKYSSSMANVFASGEHILGVAGSPKLCAYETDFGWGRPAKTEVVHIDNSGAIYISESRNDTGGIEVGICQNKHQMEIFTSIFQAGMSKFL